MLMNTTSYPQLKIFLYNDAIDITRRRCLEDDDGIATTPVVAASITAKLAALTFTPFDFARWNRYEEEVCV